MLLNYLGMEPGHLPLAILFVIYLLVCSFTMLLDVSISPWEHFWWNYDSYRKFLKEITLERKFHIILMKSTCIIFYCNKLTSFINLDCNYLCHAKKQYHLSNAFPLQESIFPLLEFPLIEFHVWEIFVGCPVCQRNFLPQFYIMN